MQDNHDAQYTSLGEPQELSTFVSSQTGPATSVINPGVIGLKGSINKRIVLFAIVPSLLALALVLSFIGLRVFRGGDDTPVDPLLTVETVSPDLSGFELKVEKVTKAEQLIVNGTIVANEGFVLTAGPQPVKPSPGQLYLDDDTNNIRFYNGTQFSNIPLLGDNAIICLVGNDCGFATPSSIAPISASVNTLQTQYTQTQSSISTLQQQVATIQQISGPANDVLLQGGNTLGEDLIFGTNDAFGIQIEVDATVVAEVTQAGAARFRNRTNSTNGFEIQTASGDTLFVADTTNERIGIGTNTPSARLNVVGDSRLEGDVTVGDLLPLNVGRFQAGYDSVEHSVSNSTNSLYNDTQKYIDVDANGIVHSVYVDSSLSRIMYAKCLDVKCVAIATTIIAEVPDYADTPVIRLGSDGLPRISYVAYTQPNELHYVRCLNSDCTQKNDAIVATNQNAYYEQSFDLSRSDLPYFVFSNYEDSNVMYAHCPDNSCSSVPTITPLTLPNTLSDSTAVSIAVGADNNARILYAENGDMYYSLCTNIACSSKITQNLGLSTNNVYFNDMALDVNQNPRITYVTNNTQYISVHLLICTDSACNALISRDIDVSPSLANGYASGTSSITINSDGNPGIAFAYDGTVSGSGYIYCGSFDCSSYELTPFSDIDTEYMVSTELGVDDLPRIVTINKDMNAIQLTIFNTQNGQDIDIPGNNIGSLNALFGKAYLQGAKISSTSPGALLQLNANNPLTNLVEFSYLNNQVANIGSDETGLSIKNNLNQTILKLDNIDSGVILGGSVSSTSIFDIQDASSNSLLSADTTNDVISITSTESALGEKTVLENSDLWFSEMMTYADIDGDGYTDIIDYNYNNNRPTVIRYGDTTNSFSRIQILNLPQEVNVVYTPDLNNDGYTDIISTSGNASPTMYVLLNDGLGNFGTPSQYAVVAPNSYYSIFDGQLTDINNDGSVDIMFRVGFDIAYFLNNGDGTFAPRNTIPFTGNVFSIGAGDTTGDGYPEIILGRNDSFQILTNNQNLTFTTGSTINTEYYLRDVVVVDLNNDNKNDLATFQADKYVGTYINQNNGQFSTGNLIESVSAPYTNNYDQIKFGNFNGDLYLDLFINGYVNINDTKGRFTRSYLSADDNTARIAAFDLGNDGVEDVMVRSYTQAYILNNKIAANQNRALIEIDTKGTKVGQIIRVNAVSESDAIQVKGIDDTLLASIDSSGTLYLGQSSATNDFKLTEYDHGTFNSSRSMTAQDVNNDGFKDLLNHFYFQESIRINDGTGQFGPETTIPITAHYDGAVYIDINQDGNIDIVSFGIYGLNPHRIMVTLGTGTGGFSPTTTYTVPVGVGQSATLLSNGQVGDIDGDGDMDIYYLLSIADTNSGNHLRTDVSIWVNNGSGNFSGMNTTYSIFKNHWYSYFADLNNDGLVDILASNNGTPGYDALINNGNLSFSSQLATTSSFLGYSIDLVDINKDGNTDIFASQANQTTGENQYGFYQGNGDGTFSPNFTILLAALEPQNLFPSVELVDINSDGFLDMVDADRGVYAYFNIGSGNFSDFVKYRTDGYVLNYASHVADLNNDGHGDVMQSSLAVDVQVYLYAPGKLAPGSISVAGEYIQRNLFDSTNAFTLQNSEGYDLFKIDTISSAVRVSATQPSTSIFRVDNQQGSNILNIDSQNSSVTARSPTNNSVAFRVQNAANIDVLSVDTTNSLVSVTALRTGNITVNGKIITANTSGTTTVNVGANAGTGATASVAGNDTSATVTINTGTGSGAGTLATVTFANAFATAPRVTLAPANQNASNLNLYYSSGTGTLTILTSNAPVDATQYQITFFAVQ